MTSGVAGAITFTVGANNATSAFSGTIQNGSGTIALTKTGNGTLTLNAANSYAGDTTISVGTVKTGTAGAIPFGAGKGDVIDNATLDLNGKTQTINGLAGSGSVTSSVAGAITFTVGDNGSSSTFNGTIRRLRDGRAHEDRQRHADDHQHDHAHRRHQRQRRHAEGLRDHGQRQHDGCRRSEPGGELSPADQRDGQRRAHPRRRYCSC